MGCKANSELTSAIEDFFLQKWLQSVSSVHCSNTDPLVTPTLQSLNYNPRKVPLAPTQHPLRTLSTLRSRRETSGKCVTGRLPNGGTLFRLSSLTTPDNQFLSTNFSLPALSLFVKKKKNIGKDMPFGWQWCSALKKYFTPRFCRQLLTLTMLV